MSLDLKVVVDLMELKEQQEHKDPKVKLDLKVVVVLLELKEQLDQLDLKVDKE